jgi:hypothetical protein
MGKGKQNTVLKLFKGHFNRSGYLLILHTKAPSERKAWVNMCKQIAEKDQVHVSHVMAAFDGSKDNFKISEEP